MKKETYTFYKGQKIMLDDIYFIQALCGGDWHTPRKDKDVIDPEAEEELIITRNIKITIIETKPQKKSGVI